MKVQHRLKSTLSVSGLCCWKGQFGESLEMPGGAVTLIIVCKTFEQSLKSLRFQGIVCLDASANVSLQLGAVSFLEAFRKLLKLVAR